jgi:hypothetical protein
MYVSSTNKTKKSRRLNSFPYMAKKSPKASTSHKHQQYTGILDSFAAYMEKSHISERAISKNKILLKSIMIRTRVSG